MAEASQRKLRDMLELLIMLGNSKYGRDKKSLANYFNVSEKTIERYIKTFANVGFVIEQPEKGFFKIDTIHSNYKDLSQLLYFSEEESSILHKAISEIEATDSLKEELIKKLYSIYNFDRVATPLVKNREQQKVEALSKAIRNKKRVVLINYQSNNSESVRDRLVEPYEFRRSFTMFWALDTESEMNKTFKVARCQSVKLLNEAWQLEEQHQKIPVDDFRMSAANNNLQTPIKLTLNLKARNLMVEEYPMTERNITKISDNCYEYHAVVNGFSGIGRFILGLAAEIQIVFPNQLKTYIYNSMINNIQKFETGQ